MEEEEVEAYLEDAAWDEIEVLVNSEVLDLEKAEAEGEARVEPVK